MLLFLVEQVPCSTKTNSAIIGFAQYLVFIMVIPTTVYIVYMTFTSVFILVGLARCTAITGYSIMCKNANYIEP